MGKVQGKLRTLAEYAGLLTAYALLAWPPLVVSRGIARLMADAWRRLDRRHRRRAEGQCRERLGVSRAEARRLIRDNYRHYAKIVMEVARLRRMPIAEVMRRTDTNGCDQAMQDILARGKGLIVVTGHLGNWEWGSVVIGKMGLVEGLIARPFDNPLIHEFVRTIRESTGASVWDKYGSMRKALATLRGGKAFVAVMDQDGGRTGCRAPFLGRDSSTMAAPVDLAIRTGAPLFVGAVIRNGAPLTFRMVPKRVHWPRADADPREERIRLTTAINDDLSAIIREHPEQWIWTHRRWKTTP